MFARNAAVGMLIRYPMADINVLNAVTKSQWQRGRCCTKRICRWQSGFWLSILCAMTNEASFEKHRAHIPCYALRHLLGLRNSSNRVEKANDLVIAQRQKHNGMSWSTTGSIALAQIKALFLNHEISRWLHSRTLPLFLPAASMDYSNRSGRNILKILFIMKEYCLFMGNMVK